MDGEARQALANMVEAALVEGAGGERSGEGHERALAAAGADLRAPVDARAIFGLEVSRLARSSADLQRLLELCGLTDTLIVDADGIYDLRSFNDRLLVGLKGTMSEAELHILAGRLQGAKRAAAERGELRFPLPVGYVYDEDGQTIIDADEEVRAAVADLFAAFAKTGSAYGVVGEFGGRRFPRRAYGGAWAGELRWGRLTHSRVIGVLQNPAYAGAYVFGRYRSRRAVQPDGTITTKTSELPRSEWAVLIREHHPGYVSWGAFLANEQRLQANNSRRGARPVREGRALCQGIVRCGGCGRPMSTSHRTGQNPVYDCSRSRADHVNTPGCRGVSARVVDELVARRLLEALAPQEIALALASAEEVADRRARSSRALELRVERARYEAARAERAFHACEPENRLVARSLERRWEQKLGELKDAEGELAEQAAPAPEPSPEEIEALAANVPALWAAETTSERDRKRLLRALISDVTLTSQPDERELRLGIRWRSGAAEEHLTLRPESPGATRRTPRDAVDLITRLGPHRTDEQLVAELKTAGLRTGTGLPFDERAVRWVRYAHKIAAAPKPLLEPDELTVGQVADRLGVSVGAVYYWISHGQLAARRGPANRLCVPFG
ncbi:MAG: recombinase family protein, partial [Actinobacteria bacterium]|nr:recombinase family protein [Actinomycetota bacterium]